MLSGIPAYIIITFLVTVFLTGLLFIRAVKNKTIPVIVLTLWLAVTGILAFKEFFIETTTTPPPTFIFAVAPAFFFIIVLLVTKKGLAFTNTLNLRHLTLLHIIRIPVEVVLYWLAVEKAIPDLMTIEGRNFDIISGITAPAIYFICFKDTKVINRQLLLAWNFICLGLLLNIVINAILSAPFSFQQFAFDQPNIAVLYFPFVWLPSFIVMLVLLSHLVVIIRLLKRRPGPTYQIL